MTNPPPVPLEPDPAMMETVRRGGLDGAVLAMAVALVVVLILVSIT